MIDWRLDQRIDPPNALTIDRAITISGYGIAIWVHLDGTKTAPGSHHDAAALTGRSR